jgi:hypothetical protein
MHAILCSGFDDVKVLPLHEVERAAAVEMIRYGYPFVRVRWVFDLAVRFANCTSDPCEGFLDGVMKRSEEFAVCVDPICGLYTTSFTRLFKEFWFRGRKKLSRGRVSSSELCSSSLPTSSPPDGDDKLSSSSLK